MKKDKFWKYFLATCAAFLLGGGATAYGIVLYVAPQQLPAIVLPGANTILDNSGRAQSLLVATTSEYFFQESVPFGYDHWSWDSTVNWRNGSHYFEGTHSLGVVFHKSWGGIGIESPGTITRSYSGISLAVYAEQSIEDLYIELHGKNDVLIGRQSIGWYSPEKTLTKGKWHTVTIPLENFGGYFPPQIVRVSILARGTGSAYFDSIRMVRNTAPQERWNPQTEEGSSNSDTPPVSELMKQSTPSPLPYELQFTPVAGGLWYPLTGILRFTATEALLGLSTEGTDSTSIFLGGKNWRDYRIDTVIDWGTPSTFSILARFTDEKNYATCAFSGYGMYTQIYHMRNGEFVLVAEAPELSIPHLDPWKGVRHSAEVSGNRISCFLDGEKVLSADLPSLPTEGSIGFEAWSREKGGIPHRIQSAIVSPL